MRIISLLAFVTIFIFSCEQPGTNVTKLPILGERDIVDGDTTFHTIPDFAFLNQDSQMITNADFEGKAYVVDFFFTSCPTICPKVKKQMLRLYDKYKDESNLILVSHTIDPKRDSVAHLKTYAENLGVSAPKWHFLTGDKWDLHGIADDYFSIAIETPNAPGGFDHSGRLILVDKNRNVRSFCNGTDPESVDEFLVDVDLLLDSEYK